MMIEERARIAQRIQTRGWATVKVAYNPDTENGKDFIPHCYSVGLTDKGLPEVLLLGNFAGFERHIVNGIARYLIANGFKPGEVTEPQLMYEDGKVVPCELIAATDTAKLREYMPELFEFYKVFRRQSMVAQVVFRNPDFNLPGDIPLLGTKPDLTHEDAKQA